MKKIGVNIKNASVFEDTKSGVKSAFTASAKVIGMTAWRNTELYSELSNEPETDHFSGFIYYKDNNDYLCSSSYKGYINIWDLYNKKIYKTINTFNIVYYYLYII